MRRPRLIAALMLVAMLGMFSDSYAANPPMDLARKRATELSKSHPAFDVRVTELGGAKITEYQGTVSKDARSGKVRNSRGVTRELADTAGIAWRLLWVATLSAQPFGAVESWGKLDAKVTRIWTRNDEFVYTYGDMPRVGVHRVSGRLVSIEVVVDGVSWRVEAEWEGAVPVVVRVSTADAPILTARFLALKG